MTAKVGSVTLTSSRIFSERDFADRRFREAIVVIVRTCENSALLEMCMCDE